MAQHKSAVKANKQQLKRRERNRSVRARVTTCKKTLLEALGGKKKKDQANLTGLLTQFESEMMQAARKGVYKKHTASRHVSRMHVAVHKALG